MIMRENDISDLRKSIFVPSYSYTGNSRKKKNILKNYPLVGKFVTENHVMFMKQFVICIQF